MAISKVQPMRPAEIQLVDLANQLETTTQSHTRSIATLTEGLADEISERESADTAIQSAITAETQARTQAVQTLTNNLASETQARTQAVQTLTNNLASETQARTQAVQGLQTQIGDGFSETSVTQSLSATNQQILGLTNDVDQIEATLAGNVNVFINRFRVGHTESFEIAAGSAQAGSVTFNTPYADTAQVCVFLCCVDPGEIFTNLECQLISATYSGFSYNIVNNDQTDAHTVALGFVAAQVN